MKSWSGEPHMAKAKASFTWEGTKELQRTLRRIGAGVPSILARALYIEAEAIMAVSARLVPVDRGLIRSSGHVRPPRVTRNHVSVAFGYDAPHALWVHEGTGPAVGRPAFMPPSAPFEEWGRRVLGEEGLGYVLARSVGKHGTKGSKFLETAFRKRQHGMGRRIARAVQADIARLTPKGR